MKTAQTFVVTVSTLIMMTAVNAAPQERARTADHTDHFIGFADKDKDGINDKFKDTEGDGINDITGKPYEHNFKFADKNDDKINDLWTDKDGDGVNDLSKKHKNSVKLCVLDSNADGLNDVTGEKFGQDDLHGQKFGFIDERTGKIQGKFMDEDGDGIDDRMADNSGRQRRQNRDMFVDEDGDGICDGRGERLQRKRQQQKRGHGGRH